MVETWSKTRSVKDLAYGVTQWRRGAARLQAVSKCSSAPSSSAHQDFSSAGRRSQEREGLDYRPQPKRIPPAC